MSEKFSVDAWKDRAKQKVATVSNWLGLDRAVPYVTYATTAMVSVWPLVEAVAKAGAAGNTALLPEFYLAGVSLLSSVGGNLIAEQIQRWFDRSQAGDPPTEEEVMGWVSQQAAENPELLTELDHLIEEFEILPAVQEQVPQGQMADFVSQIRTEMEQLGNWGKFAETITNSQVVLGDNNKVLGEGAVNIDGDVSGNFIAGEGNQITINHNYAAIESDSPQPTLLGPSEGEPSNLREKMTSWLSQSDLKTICFDVGIDFYNLNGNNFSTRTVSLIQLMRKQNRIEELIKACESANKFRNWRE